MKTNRLQILDRPRGAWTAFAALLLVLGTTHSASAAWGKAETKTAWDGFNSRFEEGTGDGMYDCQVNDHSGTTGNFWKDAELIEMTEDAYYWLGANGYANASVKTQINNLCSKFTTRYNAKYGSDWDGNTFSDDLMWATLAFTRAYQITGNTAWRTRATSTYDKVWSRNSNVRSNGLNQQKGKSDPQANVNYAAVIAGYLLVANGASSVYQTHADDVWYYAVTTGNLYNNNTGDSAYGKVWDSPGSHSDYSFNYGIAIQAAVRKGDKPTCQAMVSYLENKAFSGGNYPYNGTYSYNNVSYHVLPNYNVWADGSNRDWNSDKVGFNGICMRGVGFAYSKGYLADSQLPWALANIAAAHREINDTTYRLIWTNWQDATPDDGTAYSWSCSSALSAMFDLPLP